MHSRTHSRVPQVKQEAHEGAAVRLTRGGLHGPEDPVPKARSRVYPLPMPNQIVLAWEVDVTNSTLGPAAAATAMSQAKVPLYQDPETDPVLGQLLGLTVASDVTSTPGGGLAKRTLTLNMTAVPGSPHAPPPFPCHPIKSTLPTLPYELRSTVTLPGAFFVTNGSMAVPVGFTQIPSLSIGDEIQFLSQQGVIYVVTAVGATSISISAPYTGTTANTGAYKEVAAPVTLAAVYSSSGLDTSGVATTPAIAAGPGARTVNIEYTDSLGAGPFTVTVPLNGKCPAPVTLAGGSKDIAEIVDMWIASTGSFGNSVGQITLVGLSSALPAIQATDTPFDFRIAITDESQGLIEIALAYLPPSYFALSQQGASEPVLLGDFIVTTGSTNVPTTVDQTAVLSAGNVIRFAEQQGMDHRQLDVDTHYVIAAVSPKVVTLARAFTGLDNHNTGDNQVGTNANAGTMGNMGQKLNQKATSATLTSPSPAAVPSNAQLSGPLGQFVALETAGPPRFPPGNPVTVPVPAFLSGMFTKQIQLALAGVPVVAQPIVIV